MKYKKLLKTIAVLAIFLIISCLFSYMKVNAETLEEEQSKIQAQKNEAEQKLTYVQEDLSTSVVKIQELDDSIKNAEKEISSLDEQLKQMQTKIDENNKKIEEEQKKYEHNKKLSEERLVTMYETGEVSFLEVLLNSTGIVDFLNNYYSLRQLVEMDMELLTNIEHEKNEIEKTKKELEEQKSNLKVLRAKQQQTYVTMENNKVIQQNYMENLSVEEQKLQEQIQKYKEEEARIENLILLASNQEYSGNYTGGVMRWPIAKSGTYITSPYGEREHPIQGVIKKHTGIDIGNAGFGAPVIAAADGIVTMAGWYGGYGICVMINHGNGISTLYGHGQKVLTTVGTEVKQGDLIMEVGSTGQSTGPHLHFEVRINGTPTNPLPYLKGENSTENDSNANTNVVNSNVVQ